MRSWNIRLISSQDVSQIQLHVKKKKKKRKTIFCKFMAASLEVIGNTLSYSDVVHIIHLNQSNRFDLTVSKSWLPEVWMISSWQSLMAICPCLFNRLEICDLRNSSSIGKVLYSLSCWDKLSCCWWVIFWSWVSLSESELISLDICKTPRQKTNLYIPFHSLWQL